MILNNGAQKRWGCGGFVRVRVHRKQKQDIPMSTFCGGLQDDGGSNEQAVNIARST